MKSIHSLIETYLDAKEDYDKASEDYSKALESLRPVMTPEQYKAINDWLSAREYREAISQAVYEARIVLVHNTDVGKHYLFKRGGQTQILTPLTGNAFKITPAVDVSGVEVEEFARPEHLPICEEEHDCGC